MKYQCDIINRTLESDEGMQTMESDLYDDDITMDDDQLSAVPRQQEMLKSVTITHTQWNNNTYNIHNVIIY